MINLQMTAVFLVDVIKIVLIFSLILGFSFRKGKLHYAAALAVAICGVLVILGLQDQSNRIFFTLAAHVLLAMALFDGKTAAVGELAVLVHFLISIIDSFCEGIILLFYKGQSLMPENISGFNVISDSMGVLFLLAVILLCHKKRKAVRDYLNQFNLKNFLYYFLYILLSGIIIGYAEIAALDADIVYRLRAVVVIGTSLFGILIVASGIMIDVLLLQKNRLNELVRENSRCIEAQTRQYILLNTKQTELKKFRHDYNAHMRMLQRLSEQGETDKLHRYIASMQEMRKSFDFVNTNNVIGDAVINEYYEKGIEEHIKIKVFGRFPDRLYLSETDLCILLSNTVKNAYEATKKCKENRKIMIMIGVFRQKVLITIKNPVREAPVIKDGLIQTTKADTENHGIGLENVSDVIVRNNADVTWRYEKGLFVTEILF